MVSCWCGHTAPRTARRARTTIEWLSARPPAGHLHAQSWSPLAHPQSAAEQRQWWSWAWRATTDARGGRRHARTQLVARGGRAGGRTDGRTDRLTVVVVGRRPGRRCRRELNVPFGRKCACPVRRPTCLINCLLVATSCSLHSPFVVAGTMDVRWTGSSTNALRATELATIY
jgi:hypothetical protein